VRGFYIATDLPADVATNGVQSCVHDLGWTQQWTHPYLAKFEKGSVVSDLILGPFMPHQVAECEVTTEASGQIAVTLRQTKSRWYGGEKTEPRKARRDFDRLATTIAQQLSVSGRPAAAVLFQH